MRERPEVPAAPELVLKTDAGSTVMSPSRDYRVGRDPSCDITIDGARISWHHAVLRAEADHWTVVDEGSKNGT
jgi:FOG: FHA domain